MEKHHITEPGCDGDTLSFSCSLQVKMITLLNNSLNLNPYSSLQVRLKYNYDNAVVGNEGSGALFLQVDDDD